MSFDALQALLQGALDEEIGSAIELVVAVEDDVVFHFRAGLAQRHPEPRPLPTRFAAWDLASLSKVLAGAPAVYQLIDAGELEFDTAVHQILPEVPQGITVAHLLSHCSGYPAWRPLYDEVPRAQWGTIAGRARILELARSTPLESEPGTQHRYSDLGFLTLCALVERVSGLRLDEFAPVGVGLTWGGTAQSVATQDCPVRGGVVVGEVDDLNCFAMGGVSTHAGLFGGAAAVAQAGFEFLEQARQGSAIATAWSTRGPGSHWLGWDGRSDGSSSGAFFPPDSVGHLGFTGTSIWIAPSWGVTVVLLTNRVHPSVEDLRIRQLRPAVHDAVVGALVARGLTKA